MQLLHSTPNNCSALQRILRYCAIFLAIAAVSMCKDDKLVVSVPRKLQNLVAKSEVIVVAGEDSGQEFGVLAYGKWKIAVIKGTHALDESLIPPFLEQGNVQGAGKDNFDRKNDRLILFAGTSLPTEGKEEFSTNQWIEYFTVHNGVLSISDVDGGDVQCIEVKKLINYVSDSTHK